MSLCVGLYLFAHSLCIFIVYIFIFNHLFIIYLFIILLHWLIMFFVVVVVVFGGEGGLCVPLFLPTMCMRVSFAAVS